MKKAGRKRSLAALLLSGLLLFAFARAEELPLSARPPRLRALLIGCDYFVSQEDTYPAAEHNLRLLSDALSGDSRRYMLIRSYAGKIASVEALEAAVQGAFQGAGPEDVSLLYISTHGLFADGASNASAALLLSDGETEEMLEAAALEKILDAVPGQKVVILDACNSGAFIGKGLSGGADQLLFSNPAYKILCSAGGSEASWYWQGTASAGDSGASYFATVLANGLGVAGDYAADANLDGQITLAETYAFLRENYAASTPQVYPQEDKDFVLFAYDPQRLRKIDKAITDITFEDTLLTAGQSEVTFSFTVQRQVELYYQIIYHQDGAWQFGQAQHYLDGEQLDGTVLPGRKERTLSLDTGWQDAHGYAIIQLITREEDKPVFQGARLLCVQPAEGEVRLSVITDPAFLPAAGQELCVLVQHDVPCGLTVNIRSAEGAVVRRLGYEEPSRPQQLSPAASTFYWDGRLSTGESAPPGSYTVQVRVRLGGKTFLAESLPFQLLEESGMEQEGK